jgi:cytochrome c-type biogenesis protein CcsB
VDLAFLEFTCVAYLVAAVALAYQVLKPVERLATAGAVALAGGFLLQSISIGLHFLDAGVTAVTAFHEGLAFFAWLMVGSYLIVGRGQRLDVIGAVLAPIAFAMTLASVILYADGGGDVPTSLRSPWLPIHITLAFLGNAVFAVAFAISIVYLVQEKGLKRRSKGAILRKLPSLEQLDRLNYRCLAWGFPLLSLGILSGGIWALNTSGTFWSWEVREVLSLLTWVLYGGLLQFRLAAGLRGRRAATLTIVGFSIVVLSFVSINVLSMPGRHGGGLGS